MSDDVPQSDPKKAQGKGKASKDGPLKLPPELEEKYKIPELDAAKQEKLRKMPKEAREALRRQVLQLIESDDVLGIMGGDTAIETTKGNEHKDAREEPSGGERREGLDDLFSPMPSKSGKGQVAAKGSAESGDDEAQRTFGSITCYNCQGDVPILSEERPLIVKCPNCGTEGIIGED